MTGPLAYIGGKHRIAKQIIALFPAHRAYVEAFAGGAQVFFEKKPSPVEVLNDLDGDVVNFFRVCQRHHGELLRTLRFVLVSRRWHSLFEAENPASLTDVERAARFFYLQKTSFAGLVLRRRHNYSAVSRPSLNLTRLPMLIEKAHARLARAHIECLPYGEVIARYDRPETLFYLDPPYWGRKLYRFNFTVQDFAGLAHRLAGVRGRFVLSLNDLPEVRDCFRAFSVRTVELPYTAQRLPGKRFRELLITNFPEGTRAQSI